MTASEKSANGQRAITCLLLVLIVGSALVGGFAAGVLLTWEMMK